ncbi:hypothetical protein [Sphingomonas faeni]|uniref:hypothetical protein n=1 Tax=Sphingomonas faeni TaxID=185950 RepID=UPI00335C9454
MTNEIDENVFSRDEVLSCARLPETGDYATDCAAGRTAADVLIVRMAQTDYTPALKDIVHEMIKIGRWGAVHIGFFQRLADRSVQALT